MEEKDKVTGWTGWVAFASLLLMFNGILQFFYGVAALFNQSWYISTNSGAAYVFSTSTWGWVSIALGVLLFATGAMLMTGNAAGRMLASLFVALGFLANLALLPIAPIWSIIAMILYAVVGYSVIAHGGEMKRATR